MDWFPPALIGAVLGFIGGIIALKWWDKDKIEQKEAEIEGIKQENDILDREYRKQKTHADDLAEEIIKQNKKVEKLKAKAEKVKDETCSDDIDSLLRMFKSKG